MRVVVEGFNPLNQGGEFADAVLFGHGESSPIICVDAPSLPDPHAPHLGHEEYASSKLKFTKSRRE